MQLFWKRVKSWAGLLSALKTPSHMILGYLLGRFIFKKRVGQVTAVMIGAGAPDLPLILVVAYIQLDVMLWGGELVEKVDALYFHDLVFITLHHLLHAPLSLVLLFALAISCHQKYAVSFLLGAASHAAIDLLTHREDAILLFWPLDHSFRLPGLVSQWDLAGAGGVLMALEAAACLLVLVYIFFIAARMLRQTRMMF